MWDVLETLLERILGGFFAILCIASVIRGVGTAPEEHTFIDLKSNHCSGGVRI